LSINNDERSGMRVNFIDWFYRFKTQHLHVDLLVKTCLDFIYKKLFWMNGRGDNLTPKAGDKEKDAI
jgi:hypothetical protein